MDDERLMLRYGKEGDVVAFEVLLKRYRNQVFGFFVRSCGDRALAEDLYQETFLRLIRSAASYTPAATFRTWIFVIARNILRDNFRRMQVRAGTLSLDEEDATTGKVHDPADTLSPDPVRSAHSAEIRNALQAALAGLPDEQREMFLLREEAGLDFEQASRIAGCSVNTAKSRMRYALMKLRDELTRRGLCEERIGQS